MWLVGMMGSGKSTAGAMAAEQLVVPFHDSDDVIVERMGCSIAQFWGERGEAAFREIEKVAIASLAEAEGIRATGGGVVLDPENRRILTETGPVVWLRASPEVLANRLRDHSDRPLVEVVDRPHVEVLTAMLAERSALYSEVATHQLDTDDLETAHVAKRVEEIWRS